MLQHENKKKNCINSCNVLENCESIIGLPCEAYSFYALSIFTIIFAYLSTNDFAS